MPNSPQSPAFIIGVTGHMDIPSGDLKEIEDRLRLIFRWLQRDSKGSESDEWIVPDWFPNLETHEGRGSGQRKGARLSGLGLRHQRIVLLTSLAPGADTIAARVALEEGIEVRAPLPFPAGLYPHSTTFTDAGDPEGAIADFDRLVSGSEAPVDSFPVLLASDLELSIEDREKVITEDLEISERRHLRYRASGEYVATHCQLLLALFQPDEPGTGSSVGSQTIVEVARRGPTSGILPGANHFPWNDSVPVIHIPCRSLKRLPVGDPERQQALTDESWRSIPGSFLPPLWIEGCHHDQSGKLDAECGRTGAEILARTVDLRIRYEEAANRQTDSQAGNPGGQNTGAISASATLLFGRKEANQAEALSAEGKAFLDRLEPIAAEQKRSSSIAREIEGQRNGMMCRMAILTFLAAFCFHCFSHWFFADKPSHSHDDSSEHTAEHEAVLKQVMIDETDEGDLVVVVKDKFKALKSLEKKFAIVFLVLTISLVAASIVSFFGYQRSRRERLRFDARALAEGLRIQFYWSVSGNRTSVSGRYMHRQNGELGWIRNAISSVSFPYFRWQDSFRLLPPPDQKLIIGAVIRNWIGVQRDYFARKGREFCHRLHRHHLFGWGMTWAGVGQVPLFLWWKLAHPHSAQLFFGSISAVLFVVFAVWLGCIILRERKRAYSDEAGGTAKASHEDVLDFLLKADFSGFALLVSSVLLALVAFVPGLAEWTPKTKDLWVILTGSCLVVGAISIAWGEKLLLAEHSRQFSAMHDLFRNASDHLNEQIATWDSGEPHPDELSRTDPLREIQETLVDIGKEALDENAEWLVLHRSRPFEPFLAG